MEHIAVNRLPAGSDFFNYEKCILLDILHDSPCILHGEGHHQP